MSTDCFSWKSNVDNHAQMRVITIMFLPYSFFSKSKMTPPNFYSWPSNHCCPAVLPKSNFQDGGNTRAESEGRTWINERSREIVSVKSNVWSLHNCNDCRIEIFTFFVVLNRRMLLHFVLDNVIKYVVLGSLYREWKYWEILLFLD